MSSNIDNFLSKLDSLNKTETVDIFIPSLQKDVSFKLFSVGQQKELIKTALTGVDGVIKSNIIYSDIIQKNCLDDVVISLEDKSAILIALRRATVGSNYRLDDELYNLDDLPTKLPALKKRSKKFKFGGFVLTASIPSIENDKSIAEKALLDLSKVKDNKKRVDSVDILLSYEVVKYIERIEGDETDIMFGDLNLHERKKIIESLPLKVNNNIISFIASVTEYSNQFSTFKDGINVDFDAGFLTRE